MNLKQLEKLKSEGKIKDYFDRRIDTKTGPISRKKISYEKEFIKAHLSSYCEKYDLKLIEELRFSERKFRFDYSIESEMLAVEYEGIFSKKSRHTTLTGYSRDAEKYNLATSLGWKVYRYTAKNYKNIINDLKI